MYGQQHDSKSVLGFDRRSIESFKNLFFYYFKCILAKINCYNIYTFLANLVDDVGRPQSGKIVS